jgi:hypothetical protein
MAKFHVLRDTVVCHLGRSYKAGEVAEFDVPFVPERDVQGRVIKGVDGKPKGKPMTIGSNLEPIVDDPAKK